MIVNGQLETTQYAQYIFIQITSQLFIVQEYVVVFTIDDGNQLLGNVCTQFCTTTQFLYISCHICHHADVYISDVILTFIGHVYAIVNCHQDKEYKGVLFITDILSVSIFTFGVVIHDDIYHKWDRGFQVQDIR